MSLATRYRQLPATGRSIGFEVEMPSGLDIQPEDERVRCREQSGGKLVGELEVTTFRAALVIDRDGILEEKAHEVATQSAQAGARVMPAIPVTLPNASGFRADVELRASPRPSLPYVYIFAIASHDLGVDGGVLVTIRCATPDWPAANTVLESLRILGRRGKTANDAADSRPALPIIGKRED